jgi:hypothetical protein
VPNPDLELFDEIEMEFEDGSKLIITGKDIQMELKQTE